MKSFFETQWKFYLEIEIHDGKRAFAHNVFRMKRKFPELLAKISRYNLLFIIHCYVIWEHLKSFILLQILLSSSYLYLKFDIINVKFIFILFKALQGWKCEMLLRYEIKKVRILKLKNFHLVFSKIIKLHETEFFNS